MKAQIELWDAETLSFRNAPGGTWRDFCDELHRDLLRRWLPKSGRRILKTDLFDEAAGTGFLDVFADECQIFGIDISPGVVADAVTRSSRLVGVVTDLRRMPFQQQSFDMIVSNSSLDHFETAGEITDTLRGLRGVLEKDGLLLVTLDNPRCLYVFLRRILPYRMLRRLGILKYPVGATFGLRRLRQELVDIGFVIEKEDVIMHVPRVLAIPACSRLDRSRGSSSRALTAMMRAEVLKRLPTRQLSGHFVAVLARRVG